MGCISTLKRPPSFLKAELQMTEERTRSARVTPRMDDTRQVNTRPHKYIPRYIFCNIEDILQLGGRRRAALFVRLLTAEARETNTLGKSQGKIQRLEKKDGCTQHARRATRKHVAGEDAAAVAPPLSCPTTQTLKRCKAPSNGNNRKTPPPWRSDTKLGDDVPSSLLCGATGQETPQPGAQGGGGELAQDSVA